MIFRTARLLITAAAAVLAVVYLLTHLRTQDSGPTFGQVLDKVSEAKSIHAKVVVHGQAGEVWTVNPRRLRWDRPDGTYQIALGDKSWDIDEKANRAKLQKKAFFQPTEEQGLDLLQLLDVPLKSEKGLRDQLADEKVQRDGRDCLIYHLKLPAKDDKLLIEAVVEAGTQQLQSLAIKTEGAAKPFSEATLLAYNAPVPPEKFVVKDTLTEDGRIGKVADVQGIVTVKPVLHERWTPIGAGMLLRPGDWVRTDNRGANAVTLRLVKQNTITLGPGTLVELVKPDQVRLLSGEAELAAKEAVELIAPNGQKNPVKGQQIYRAGGDQLVRVPQEPL
jgi:hypothetical protein